MEVAEAVLGRHRDVAVLGGCHAPLGFQGRPRGVLTQVPHPHPLLCRPDRPLQTDYRTTADGVPCMSLCGAEVGPPHVTQIDWLWQGGGQS